MHRESDTHGPRQDDTLKRELQDTLRANGPNTADEWRDPESPDDEEPVTDREFREG